VGGVQGTAEHWAGADPRFAGTTDDEEAHKKERYIRKRRMEGGRTITPEKNPASLLASGSTTNKFPKDYAKKKGEDK